MSGKANFGVIGLGVMGGNLAKNMIDNGYRVAVNDTTEERVADFIKGSGDQASHMVAANSLQSMADSLEKPRRILMMVPAGEVVDKLVSELKKVFEPGDIIIDGGNSNYTDTQRRVDAAKPLHFVGLGVSGGSEGARFGPSLMAGGSPEAWAATKDVLEAIAAKHKGDPCAAHLGPDGAGHFVKTVHNGIEYADMEMIAEIYGLMRDARGMVPKEMAPIFKAWNDDRLESYLIEITGEILETDDVETGKPIVDVILDRAGQKGTGRWTAIEAQHLGVAIPVIEAAVAARNISGEKERRGEGADRFGAVVGASDSAFDLTVLEAALVAGKVLCYAQGFELIAAASAKHEWDTPMPRVAEIWREGCIIRSHMLTDMAAALKKDPQKNLMLAPLFAEILDETVPQLRKLVVAALGQGLSIPALANALLYFDAMRTPTGTANMLQAQRDFFGSHGFERNDKSGEGFHGPWAN